MTALTFASKTPGRKDNITKPTIVKGLLCHLNRARIAVVEIDSKEQAAFSRFIEQSIALFEIEDQRFFNQSGKPARMTS